MHEIQKLFRAILILVLLLGYVVYEGSQEQEIDTCTNFECL